ncbi:MAG: hypothetical protein FWD58_09795, partial [Firmicutes bacterium]|nr:hypothetical protein [Bacillota bacterium]
MKKLTRFTFLSLLAVSLALSLSACGCDGNGNSTESVAVTWTGLAANGQENAADTTALTLTFDKDPTSLTAAHITLTGATKGELTGAGTTRTLAISGIEAGEGENVTVSIANPPGFTISGGPKTVAVHRAMPGVIVEEVAWIGLT